MRSFILCQLLLIFSLMTETCQGQSAAENPLRTHLWENRIVLLFSEDSSEEKLQAQLQLFQQNQIDMKDRDLLVYQIFPEGGKLTTGKALTVEQALYLRARYKVSDKAFTVILIGKDGGSKLRKESVVAPSELFDLIDQMPMRQSEMRRKRSKY